MTLSFSPSMIVKMSELEEDDDLIVKGKRLGSTFTLAITEGIVYLQDEASVEMSFKVENYQWMPITRRMMAFYPKNELENGYKPKSFCISFDTQKDLNIFRSSLSQTNFDTLLSSSKPSQSNPRKRKCDEEDRSCKQSDFDSRTEEGSASQYFQFYGSLFQQQNMMQDFTRTATYQRAIIENYHDFKDKVVLDVGAGSGILSFFAAQAGAKRVYAVEASSMANHCKTLIAANRLDEIIKVITGKVEEVELPEFVDVIISEPVGYMLVNERMLESYVYARKFLKKDGRMYPNKANLHIALFSDEQLYLEQSARSSFWAQESFHGINLNSLKNPALDEIFHQPIVDSWHTAILVSKSTSWTINFEEHDVNSLHRIEIPFELNALRTTHIHGIATWFDIGFFGQKRTIWLSTAPTEPLTHWYQVRCLLKSPLLALENQLVTGKLLMVANDKQSYDLELEVRVNGQVEKNTLDLKMPHFRYTGQPIPQPPGNLAENPSDQLNQNLDQTNLIQPKETPICHFLANSNIAINENETYGK